MVESSQIFGVGIMVRDYMGVIICTIHQYMTSTFSSHVAEMLVVREGVLLAQKLNVTQYIVETDALTVVKTLDKRQGRAMDAGFVAEMRNLCAQIGNVVVRHCSRNANNRALVLAQKLNISKASCTCKL